MTGIPRITRASTNTDRQTGRTKIAADQLPPEALGHLQRLIDAGAQDPDRFACLDGRGVVGAFEEAFADYCGCQYAVSTNSGTSALHLALMAGDVGPGDEVITSPYGWPQTAFAILATGATPVFADIDPERMALDPQAVSMAVSEHTRAVMVTHLFGIPADMTGLRLVCEQHGLLLMADCAQALGTRLAGNPVAALADISAFSFGRGKLLCLGEGGMVTTANTELHDRILLMGQHPVRSLLQVEDAMLPSVEGFGHSYRMHSLAAAIGLGLLDAIEEKLEQRQRWNRRLAQRLLSLPMIRVAEEPPGECWSYHRFVLRYVAGRARNDSRSNVARRFEGMETLFSPGPVGKPHYLKPPFARGDGHPWYPRACLPRRRHPSWEEGSCPTAEQICREQEMVLSSSASIETLADCQMEAIATVLSVSGDEEE